VQLYAADAAGASATLQVGALPCVCVCVRERERDREREREGERERGLTREVETPLAFKQPT
jgi:hypothetical protein